MRKKNEEEEEGETGEGKKTPVKKRTVKKTGVKKRVSRKGGAQKAGAEMGGLGEEVLARIQGALLELMAGSESDSVRVAAAKALMDRFALQGRANEGEHNEGLTHDEDEQEAALVEARAFLDAVAALRSGGVSGAGAVDREGAASATDAAG